MFLNMPLINHLPTQITKSAYFSLITSHLKQHSHHLIIYFNNIFPKSSTHVNNLIFLNKWGEYADYFTYNDFPNSFVIIYNYGFESI